MIWLISLAVCSLLAMVALYILLAKRHDNGPVSGRFNFDGYKENELSQRGVQDKTKWR